MCYGCSHEWSKGIAGKWAQFLAIRMQINVQLGK